MNKDRFKLTPDNLVATDTDNGKQYLAVSTNGEGGCVGCYFWGKRIFDACLSIPCDGEKWKDGSSRIWRDKITFPIDKQPKL